MFEAVGMPSVLNDLHLEIGVSRDQDTAEEGIAEEGTDEEVTDDHV